MKIGEAVEAMKQGMRVRRAGWNGKGMHVYLEDAFGVVIPHPREAHSREYEPVICMFTAQGKHQPGWLASQSDLLADDWEVVDG